MSAATDAGNDDAAWEGDAAARERIRTDLDCNMLVEAGAGSGKTTSLVGRMCSLVMRGEPVESIAAVTFTRKAANELRERFENELEKQRAESEAGSEPWLRCECALRDIDRAFLGTIHSFCARILREHPLEISLDPNFAEVSDTGWEELCRGFWTRWLERRRSDWSDIATLCAALEQITQSACGITQKRWSDDKTAKTAAKTLAQEFISLLDGEIKIGR